MISKFLPLILLTSLFAVNSDTYFEFHNKNQFLKKSIFFPPRNSIVTFINDNKALMRRMHGTLVEPLVEDEGTLQTPASTTFVKSVRSFRGLRFTRSLHEGEIRHQIV